MSRLDRQVDKDAGGLVTYVRDGFTASSELNAHNVSDPDLEVMWTVMSKANMRRIVIANVYRPPSGNIVNALDKLKKSFNDIDSDKYPEIFMMGDFNIDYLHANPNQDKLNNIMAGLGVKQLIKEITRYNPNREGKDSILDLIIKSYNLL